jgi:hypothetical protein
LFCQAVLQVFDAKQTSMNVLLFLASMVVSVQMLSTRSHVLVLLAIQVRVSLCSSLYLCLSLSPELWFSLSFF